MLALLTYSITVVLLLIEFPLWWSQWVQTPASCPIDKITPVSIWVVMTIDTFHTQWDGGEHVVCWQCPPDSERCPFPEFTRQTSSICTGRAETRPVCIRWSKECWGGISCQSTSNDALREVSGFTFSRIVWISNTIICTVHVWNWDEKFHIYKS